MNENSHIIKKIKNIKEKYGYLDEPTIFKEIDNKELDKLEELPIEIVTSDSPRVGKSTYITTTLKNKGYLKYIIPLGDIDGKLIELYTRALEINKNEKIAIVIELYENADELTYNLIRYFLFKILILKCYNSFNYISQDIYIFIEVSSDYINFEEDYNF